LTSKVVPRAILDKPSELTPAEWRSVVQHPRIGQVILEQATMLRDSVPIILHHHERFGGHGYPYGLRANEIPLGARIVAIADAYDAMTHDRPYSAMSRRAIGELRLHADAVRPELVTFRPYATVRRARLDCPPTDARRRRSYATPSATGDRRVETCAEGHGLVDLGRRTTGQRGDGPGMNPISTGCDRRGSATECRTRRMCRACCLRGGATRF
jgi:hypothetical protein